MSQEPGINGIARQPFTLACLEGCDNTDTYASTAKLSIGPYVTGSDRFLESLKRAEPHLKTARTVRGADWNMVF